MNKDQIIKCIESHFEGTNELYKTIENGWFSDKPKFIEEVGQLEVVHDEIECNIFIAIIHFIDHNIYLKLSFEPLDGFQNEYVTFDEVRPSLETRIVYGEDIYDEVFAEKQFKRLTKEMKHEQK